MKYLYTFILVVVLASCSKEDNAKAEYKEQYIKIAETIAAQIPSNARVSLKLTSPDKNGLPEDFLRKLMAEFSGALVQSSKSRFQILNRNSTEEIWQEAVEFNNQDVAKITKTAGADVSVSLSPKVNEKGIDLSVTAYSLKEESMGNVLASASELIPMNVKAELGVDVKNLDMKIEKITKLLDKEGEVKKNELSELFVAFAEGQDDATFLNVYKVGCEKPNSISFEFDKPKEGDNKQSGYLKYDSSRLSGGLSIKCEVYIGGLPIAVENAMRDKTMDINTFSFVDAYAHSVNAISLRTRSFQNRITIPSVISKFSKLIACEGSASYGSNIYEIHYPNTERFYAAHTWSGGSAGTNYELYLFRDTSYLQGFENYSKNDCYDSSDIGM